MVRTLWIVGLLGMLSACGQSGGEAPAQVKADDTITFAAGTEYLLKLESNPTTGYVWTCDMEPGGVMAIATDAYIADPAPEGLVGSGGHQVFSIIPYEAGRGTLKCTYARSPEDVAQTRVFTLIATP